MEDHHPLISVIIPVYNGGSFILETLQSLQRQTFTQFEVICVDDSSTDNTFEILKGFQNEDPRFRVYRKENEGTAAKGVNFALRYVTGKYIMYSSQDDLFSTNLLEEQYRGISTNKYDAVVPKMCFYYSESQYSPFKMPYLAGQEIDGTTALILSLNWKIHGFVLWNASIVLKTGFFDFSINGDEYTTRVLYGLCSKVGFSDGVFYYRKNNLNSITRKWNIKILESFTTFDALLDFITSKRLDKYRGIVIQQVLFDLVRVKTIALKASTSMDEEMLVVSSRKIRELYEKYKPDYAHAQYGGVKQMIIGKFISSNFYFFVFFCKVFVKLRNDRV